MTVTPLLSEIAKPKANLEAIAERMGQRPESLPEIFDGLQAEPARMKYGCLKILRVLSEKNPGVIYPYFDRIAHLLDSENTILKWGAIIIIGNLSTVDSRNKIDGLLDEYLRPISGPVLITAANTIGGAAKIVRAKPHLAERIIRALLQVETAKFQTTECRNVALGHVLKAMELFYPQAGDSQVLIDFARRQIRNRRNAVKQRAGAFLKKHDQSTEHCGGTKRQSNRSGLE